ncbi:hypothetical protein ABC347_08065 [Sphingomonas sp. 1P06PA]|uniref:hypothetical protein n=1 Tax=Sphingomonas sp. 1P06PA TaxID=554121 RepID=UPI0039A53F59
MSFRYKSALVTLISMIAVYAWYFARVANGVAREQAVPLLLGTVIALVVVLVIGHILLAATSPDCHAPMDERERAIDRRATAVGYYLLIVAALAAAALVHVGAGASRMANAILLAIVIAECGRQAMFLALHHRTL